MIEMRDVLQKQLDILNLEINISGGDYWYSTMDDNNNILFFDLQVDAENAAKHSKDDNTQIFSNNPAFNYISTPNALKRYARFLDLMQTKEKYPDRWTENHELTLVDLSWSETPIFKTN